MFKNKSRFLITSADERTWKFDRPVIFLGEWCKRFDRKHIWSELDSIVAEPYGLSLSEKERDLLKVREMAKNIFPELCSILNEYHNITESERYWKIILGHWFRRNLELTYNRFNTLVQCTSQYDIDGISFFGGHDYKLSTMTSAEANMASQDDVWNNLLLKKMHIFNPIKDLNVNFVNEDVGPYFKMDVEPNRSQKSKKELQLEVFSIVARKFMRNSDIFIINSYLHPKSEILLQLALHQFPQLNRSVGYSSLKPHDIVARQELKSNFQNKEADEIENLVRNLIFESMPICFLEGFDELQELAEAQNWPKSPKLIFTSNNFDTDEVFKVWTANKIKSGAIYTVGQHGNAYGTHRFFDPTIEEETSNHFLTWGWGDELENHDPAFILSQDRGNMGVTSKSGGLLLVQSQSVVRLQTWDETSEFLDTLNKEKTFISNLHPMVKNRLILRPHPVSRISKFDTVMPLLNICPEIRIVKQPISLSKLVPMSRLVIYSYDSTGMLKTMAENIPTMAFWQNGFDHLLESAIPYYSLLAEVGIIHLTPESAALKVNEVWGDIDSWWKSSEVQSARELFCSRYARSSDKPIRDLSRILLGYL